MNSAPATPVGPDGSAAFLTINLGALARNWRRLAARAAPGECAAVVKADAYGTGLERAGPPLWGAGCRIFFVAHGGEAGRLRAALPPEATIYVLNGLPPGAGLLRSLSTTDVTLANGHPCPIVGRISMDLSVVDLTDAPPLRCGDRVTLIGGPLDVDEVGRRAGTIGYKILTDLGRRYDRAYLDGAT